MVFTSFFQLQLSGKNAAVRLSLLLHITTHRVNGLNSTLIEASDAIRIIVFLELSTTLIEASKLIVFSRNSIVSSLPFVYD